MSNPEKLVIPSLRSWRWRAQSLLLDSEVEFSPRHFNLDHTRITRSQAATNITYFFNNIEKYSLLRHPDVQLEDFLSDSLKCLPQAEPVLETEVDLEDVPVRAITNVLIGDYDKFLEDIKQPFSMNGSNQENTKYWLVGMQSILAATRDGSIFQIAN